MYKEKDKIWELDDFAPDLSELLGEDEDEDEDFVPLIVVLEEKDE